MAFSKCDIVNLEMLNRKRERACTHTVNVYFRFETDSKFWWHCWSLDSLESQYTKLDEFQAWKRQFNISHPAYTLHPTLVQKWLMDNQLQLVLLALRIRLKKLTNSICWWDIPNLNMPATPEYQSDKQREGWRLSCQETRETHTQLTLIFTVP